MTQSDFWFLKELSGLSEKNPEKVKQACLTGSGTDPGDWQEMPGPGPGWLRWGWRELDGPDLVPFENIMCFFPLT